MIYDVRCPRCDRHAHAAMVVDGRDGTYREPRLGYRVGRITCTHCGLVRDATPAAGQDYALWYKVAIADESVWARNRSELDALIAWLRDDRRDAPAGRDMRALVEILPAWISRRRDEVVARLAALIDT